jgi:hypothetical protein
MQAVRGGSSFYVKVPKAISYAGFGVSLIFLRRLPGRSNVIVQGVIREGDRGRQAVCCVLKRFPLLRDHPHARSLPRGAISPATLAYSWYTRAALFLESPP